MMEAGYLFAAMTGFLGGFGHCIGMCGPLVASSTLHAAASGSASFSPRKIVPQALYHAGRLTTYGIVGACMGLAGSFVNVAVRLTGIQNGVMLAAGLLMVLMGLGILGVLSGTGWMERHNTLVLRLAKGLFGGVSAWRYYPLGLILGLLPCGLSYTAFIAAAGSGTPVSGAFTMLSFGAGTVPALGLFGAAMTYVGSRMRVRMRMAGGVAVTVMGLYYMQKGIQLYAAL